MYKKNHEIKSSILKAYDIRGVVDKDMNEVDAYFIGRSFGTILNRRGKKTCALGYDGRHTSPLYSKECAKGLADSGIDVTIVGLLPTPAVYFAMKYLNKDAGMIISASHNPSEYNGFKMLTQDGPFYGNDIKEIGNLSKNGDFTNGNGKIVEQTIRNEYIKHIIDVLKPGKKMLNVVWDAGNGADAAVLDDIVKQLPGKQKTIFSDVDGDFPNHHPDPSVAENMVDLQNEVKKGGYDLGIAFDGDGDRLGVVDSNGYVLYGDQLLIIYARDFLKNNPGAKVMSEVKASRVLYDDIKEHGGIPVMWKTGHSTLKAKMKEDKIELAGETSGHIFFAENDGFDDGLYGAMKLLNILNNADEKLSDMIAKLPHMVSTREIRITVGDDKKFDIVKEVVKKMKEQNREFSDVDGVRANTENGWWIFRASNTQPDLTIRCEATNEKELEKTKDDLKALLKSVGVNDDF